MECKAITDEDFQKVLINGRYKGKWNFVFQKLDELGGRMFIDELPQGLLVSMMHHYRPAQKIRYSKVDGGYVVWLEPIQGGTDGV